MVRVLAARPNVRTGDPTMRTGVRTVSVTAPARLHLGFLDMNGSRGRRFGSVGLTLEGPRVELSDRARAMFSIVGGAVGTGGARSRNRCAAWIQPSGRFPVSAFPRPFPNMSDWDRVRSSALQSASRLPGFTGSIFPCVKSRSSCNAGNAPESARGLSSSVGFWWMAAKGQATIRRRLCRGWSSRPTGASLLVLERHRQRIAWRDRDRRISGTADISGSTGEPSVPH